MAWSAPPSTCPSTTTTPTASRSSSTSARTPASGDRIGALFVNPGGPGAGAAEYAELLPYVLPEEITEHFDIVGVDPRGVGGSTPIDCGMPRRGAVRRRPHLRGRRRRGGLPRGERGVRRRLRGEVRRRAPARRHARRRPRHGRRARRHGRRAAQLPRLQLRHRDRAGVRRPVPRPCPVDGPRRRRASSGPTGLEIADDAGGRLRAGPRSLRRVLRRGGGMRHGGRHARRGRGGAGPRRGARRHPRRRTPTAPPARARPTWGSATRCTPRASGTTWRRARRRPRRRRLAGSSTWPTATSTSAPSRSTSR